MQRFFVPPTTLTGREAVITGETARQISRVLRMQPGDQIYLLDGLGTQYLVTVIAFSKDTVTGEIVEQTQGSTEPTHKVTIYLSLLNKVDKFEWALQKCTEIGAAAFVPVRAARSITDMPGPSKIERWQRIIQEAAEQSGRTLLPPLHHTLTMPQAIAQQRTRQDNHIAIIPALGATNTLGDTLRGLGRESTNLSLFIGPEGGFTDTEIHAATDAGIIPITLGPRTLRAETAAVAALTMTLYEYGEMR